MFTKNATSCKRLGRAQIFSLQKSRLLKNIEFLCLSKSLVSAENKNGP
jgi:hypothetical protein